jgi:alpha-tubulin suppressor-like RCC1 family protein
MSVATDLIKMAEVKQPPSAIQFVHVAPAHDGAKHAIGIDADGTAYSWGSNNAMGQLGRSEGELSKPYPVLTVPRDADIRFSRGFAGGLSESGHSAILDTTRTRLYIAGCDRWQQLGMGSSSGGASGYTWTGWWPYMA